MKALHSIIESYINGNIADARKRAKRHSETSIISALIIGFGYSETKARLTAHHIKTGEGWQSACDAE